MPSISESPLEQDFTVEGKPSKLGCPFASMANKRLSSHAASVLSRYNPESLGPAVSSQVSSVSRVNGRESLARKSGRQPSFADPIKAEICGLSDHDEESPHSERALKYHLTQQANAEIGVCPIRFLDQHSPEEVATYFERHKHELPRSHEVCVKRYQSNEKQIQEIDAKYGNLVSMIQGLGAKHKDMLPHEPEDGDVSQPEEDAGDTDRVRKWASSVSAQPGGGQRDAVEESPDDRQSHFERPLRDVRVGESPSRPWGIHVPAKYLDVAASEGSSKPVEIAEKVGNREGPQPTKSGGCPMGFDRSGDALPEKSSPVFLNPDSRAPLQSGPEASAEEDGAQKGRMIFTGPVFIGYSAEDAAKIMRDSGLTKPS